MNRHCLVLLATLSMLALAARAQAPDATLTSVKVTPRMAKAMDLRTTTLHARSWHRSWTAYGQVISKADLMATARKLRGAQESLQAARAAAAASAAEYRRLQSLFARHANVSRRQLESAHAARQSDHAAVQRAQAAQMAVHSAAEATWGSKITGWLASVSPQRSRLQSGKARLVRLTVPGRTQLAGLDDTMTVTLVTIDSHRIPARWVARAPSVAAGLQGTAFYARANGNVDRLAYGSGVIAHVPHGKALQGTLLPRAAVVWSGSSPWAFVRSAKGVYQRVPVSTDYPAADGWFEPHTPGAGSVVVTRGTQVLLSVQQQAVSPPAAAKGDGDND